MANIPTSLKNLKTKLNDLDLGKSKIVPIDLKELSDAVKNKVVKNTNFNTLKTKVNNSEKKIPEVTNLIHIYQCNTEKQNLEKKIDDVGKKIPNTSGLDTRTELF